jgi:glucose-6-phosphate 1-epimerase
MNLDQLNDSFAIPGYLAFEERHGLPCAVATLAAGSTAVFLHGAHVAEWTPAGQAPVLFLSATSEFEDGKAIRGGVPICFPWFGPRTDGEAGPSHGFARTQAWDFAFAALVPAADGDRLHLTFTLGPNDLSRSLGFDSFRAAFEVILGKTLTLRLTVANPGPAELKFEEALHTYFAVGDVRYTTLTGLESATFLDKTDAMQQKTGPATALRLAGETDRVYPANTATVAIHDEQNARTIHVQKSGSHTTVVWNPWAEVATRITDLPDDAWPGFVCVEIANTGADAITLAPGQSHTMQVELSIA